jgi:uncharacterized membrane protein YecN with MAPEG domain
MIINSIPISTLFIGLNGITALILSYIATFERVKTRVWHGESQEDVAEQPNPLIKPNAWATIVENTTQKLITETTKDEGLLQRKVRAHGNFAEYVPHALLFVVVLELMGAESWLIWLLGGVLTISRFSHAWGLIQVYGPSPGRAIGFFGTWLVYIIGSLACIFYGLRGVI